MVGQTHRGTPHIFMRGIGGYTHSETAVYAGGIPLFYRVNPGESGCYNTVKTVAYMPYYGDLSSHTFGCQFFCYRVLDTSPILRIVVCIWERGTIYIKELRKKITKKIAI
jgi:hypothetical protein